MDLTINPIPHRTSFNLQKANWDRYCNEIEDKLGKRQIPTNCQKGENILCTIILKAVSRHILSGRHRINREPVPAEILARMRARDDPQIQRSYLARPATDARRYHQNNKQTSEKHMETVRGDTGPQDRPFQTVENYQGNRR